MRSNIRSTSAGSRRSRRDRARRVLRHRRPRTRAGTHRGPDRPGDGPRLLRRDACARRAQVGRRGRRCGQVGTRRRHGDAVRGRLVRRRDDRLRPAQRARPRGRAARARARRATGRPGRVPRDHAPRPRRPQELLLAVVRSRHPGTRARARPRRRLLVPARLGPPLPRARAARRGLPPGRHERRPLPAAGRRHRRPARRRGGRVTTTVQDVTTLAGARTLPFLAAVEERLAAQLADDPVGRASRETLAAGGKRLRPLLVLIAAPPETRDRPELEIAACACELVHMATLVHDDVLDAAPLRRGHATVWARHGEALARATGDHLFALAFAGLTQAGSPDAVALLAQAALDLARGEALQSEQARRPETTVEAYVERCLFKTGRLFAAACALGGMFGGLDRTGIDALELFGEQLGIAFQLADDLLDCDGDPETTGKALGVDLLDGTVTLPLLLAAQRDAVVAAAVLDRERAAAG